MSGHIVTVGKAASALFSDLVNRRHPSDVDIAYECDSGIDRCDACRADLDAILVIEDEAHKLSLLDHARAHIDWEAKEAEQASQIATLAEALDVYGRHEGDCDTWRDGPTADCSCGFAAYTADLSEAAKAHDIAEQAIGERRGAAAATRALAFLVTEPRLGW